MWNFFISNLSNPFVIGLIVLVIVWFVAGWYHTQFRPLVRAWDILLALKDSVDKLTARVDVLDIAVSKLDKDLSRKVTEAGSPLRLTDFGSRIAQEVNAQQIAGQYAEQTLKIIEQSDTRYDIQTKCAEFVQTQLDKIAERDKGTGLDKRIDDAAFNNGITRQEVLEAIGIVLRDYVFELLDAEAKRSAHSSIHKSQGQ